MNSLRQLKVKSEKLEVKKHKSTTLYLVSFVFILVLALFTIHYSLFTFNVYAQNESSPPADKQQKGLKEKEETAKKEEERLIALRKDVDERIARYTKLLSQMEEALKKLEQASDDKFANIVKAYESMPPEDAAARLSALDEQTAVRIITKMKSKKAGSVIAQMEPAKAASITENITRVVKIFPTQ